MSFLSRQDIKTLIEHTESPCVSLYMPAVKLSDQTQQNPIRFHNLLDAARDRLEKMGVRLPDAEQWLAPVKELDTFEFWEHQDRGLAIFAAPNFFRYYCLPVDFEELVVTSDRFHIKPLLPILSNNGRFYILALSQHQVRLLEATRDRVREIDLGDIPTSLEEALQYEDPERQTQFHTGRPGGNRGDADPIYHGHGVGTTDNKNEIERFFQQVDGGISNLLARETAPMVLAGVDYLLPMYSGLSDYPYILEEGIEGNPDRLKPEELQSHAWKLVEPYFQQSYRDATERYRELAANAPDKTFNRVEDIVSAAYYQRLEALFVSVGEQCWGDFDLQNNRVELHDDEPKPSDKDLLDVAAAYTFANGGNVYATASEDVPNRAPMAAIARWS